MSSPPSEPTGLLFVYNADSGLFNVVADAAHKVLSPATYACNLCKVTYGWLTERRAWRDFIAGLDVPCTFLHRDELRARYPEVEVALPAVLRVSAGTPALCINAQTLQGCADLGALMALVRQRCVGA
jgi:hypothetical protein